MSSFSLLEAVASCALLVASLALLHASLSAQQRDYAFRARLFNESLSAIAQSERLYWSCAGGEGGRGLSSCDGLLLHSGNAGVADGFSTGGGPLCVTRTLDGGNGLVFAQVCR